jgi:hypothetical protein
MARIARERLPARATLPRFLAALTPQPVEALRTLFLADLLARPLGKEQEGQPVGLWDRQGTRLPRLRHRWHKAQAARGRALPLCKPTIFRRNARCCGWMSNMAPEQFSPIWLAARS